MHGERGATAFTLAIRLDASSVQLDELAANREPEPQASAGPRVTRVLLSERIEDEWQELRIDPLARVDDADDDARVLEHDDNADLAAFGGELHCVREQVPD